MRKHNINAVFRTALAAILVLAMLAGNAVIAMAADGATLAQQIAAAANGDTVTMDADYTESITVPAGKTITLDLAGHKLTASSSTAITNNGSLTVKDTVGGGTVSATASGSTNSYAILNNSGATLSVTGGCFKAYTDGSGYAAGIQNQGMIVEISGGDFIGTNPGSQYGYGLRNESSGTVELISDGWFYAAHTGACTQGLNCVALNNNGGTIKSITGGIFTGDVRSHGHGAGLRTGNTNVTISGGAFLGRNSGRAQNKAGIWTNGFATPKYADGYSLADNPHGASVVKTAAQGYVVLTDEAEKTVAAYVFDANGNVVSKWGHTAQSYDIYLEGETKTLTEAQLKDYQGQTLYVNTGDERQVLMFLGSSVTYGSNADSNSYADFLEENHGYIANKRAISGTTLVDQGNREGYIQRMEDEISPNAKIDKLIVQLSTNDAGQNKPLGTLSDSFDAADMDRNTVMGAIEYIIAYATKTWGCDVIVWTNPKYSNDNYAKMYDAVFEIQAKWSNFGVMDFYGLGDPDAALMSDSVHPKLEGYRDWMAPYAAKWLEDYDNPVVDPEKVAAVIKMIGELGENITSDTETLNRIQAARDAYNELTISEQREVGFDNYLKLDKAYSDFCELLATENGGKSVYIDFEDGTANDAGGHITPIVGDKVEIVDDGNEGKKSASFTNVTNSYDYLISWKMDEFDPLLHTKNGSSISMWVKLDENIQNNAVIFNYGFFGYRFFLRYVNNGLTVSARHEDGVGTSEFNVPGLGAYKGQWVNITVTCSASKLYTVYFNGKRAGQQTLKLSLYDIANYASKTDKRGKDESYTGYYSIGGAAYWAAGVSSVTSPFFAGQVDDFALYNRALSDFEAMAIVDHELDSIRKMNNADEVTPISGPGSGGESFDKMLDGKIGTKFGNSNYTAPFIWSTDTPVTAKYYSMTTGGDSAQWKGRNPKTWTLYGCTEAEYNGGNATWHEIDAKNGDNTLQDVNSTEYLFEIPEANAKEYQYYKLEFPSQGDFWLQLDEFTLYVDISEEDIAAAKAVDDMIAALGEITSLEQKADVEAAREAYNNLSYVGKTLVKNLDILEAARTAVSEMEDIAAAKAVDDMIAALGDITLEKKADVEAARAAYDKLTDKQKELIKNLEALEKAEAAVSELEDSAAAKAVDDMIAALGEITSLEQKADVEAARAAYNALTAEQKALVKNLEALEKAEKELESLTPDYIKGDLDNNGTVNVSDILTLKGLIMTGKWNEDQLARGDMNDDGNLTVSDILSIKSVIMAG